MQQGSGRNVSPVRSMYLQSEAVRFGMLTKFIDEREPSSDVKGTLGTFNPVPSACNHGIVTERRRSDMSGGNNGGWQDSPVMSALRDIPLHRLTSGCKMRLPPN
jgi:hypothetical protein